MIINDSINPRLKADFDKYLDDLNKPKPYVSSTTPMYSGSGSYPPQRVAHKPHSELVTLNCGHDDFRECGDAARGYADMSNIFFYEFSSSCLGARYYVSIEDFLKFTETYGIKLTDDQKRNIKYSLNSWVVCKPKSKEVIIATTRTGFERQLADAWREQREKGVAALAPKTY